jgi:hypothetical protein
MGLRLAVLCRGAFGDLAIFRSPPRHGERKHDRPRAPKGIAPIGTHSIAMIDLGDENGTMLAMMAALAPLEHLHRGLDIRATPPRAWVLASKTVMVGCRSFSLSVSHAPKSRHLAPGARLGGPITSIGC